VLRGACGVSVAAPSGASQLSEARFARVRSPAHFFSLALFDAYPDFLKRLGVCAPTGPGSGYPDAGSPDLGRLHTLRPAYILCGQGSHFATTHLKSSTLNSALLHILPTHPGVPALPRNEVDTAPWRPGFSAGFLLNPANLQR
jgi:hypothetical protein